MVRETYRAGTFCERICEWNLQNMADEVSRELCFDLWYDALSIYKNLHVLRGLNKLSGTGYWIRLQLNS